MSVIYIALPIALALGASGLIACLVCIRGGQFDDLDSPPMRMLIDDVERKNVSRKRVKADEQTDQRETGRAVEAHSIIDQRNAD